MAPTLAIILFLLAAVIRCDAAGTNYFCVVCGKGPLTGHIWLHPRGSLCNDCAKIQERCSICGLPVKDGDGHLKTGDGRFICRFDKNEVVLTQDQAKDLFEATRDEVVSLYGPQFALKYPEVTVNLFDVDYWSEKGQPGGLHKYGFSHTRKTGDGRCTHEVVLLSGRTREEMTSVAAHEYTHLWINENCPDSHRIDGDTVEAICELTAYELMGQKKLPEMQRRILENPYTRGRINDLIAVERDGGTDYVLNWVRTSAADTFDAARLAPLPTPSPMMPVVAGPRLLPQGLKFTGIMSFGKERSAVINGLEFGKDDQKTVKLRDESVAVRCRVIRDDEVVVEANGSVLTLERGEEKMIR